MSFTSSEWIRVVLIVAAVLILLAKRYDWLGKLRERKQKQERQEAQLRRP